MVLTIEVKNLPESIIDGAFKHMRQLVKKTENKTIKSSDKIEIDFENLAMPIDNFLEILGSVIAEYCCTTGIKLNQ